MAINPVKGNEAQIDQANQAMWMMPWYQDLMRQWGQSPQNTHLSDSQRRIVMQQARANGFDVSNEFEIDPAGNFNPKGHKLRNTLIVAGIAGATIATMGAAGAFSGAAAGAAGGGAGAGGAAAGTAAATGGTLAATSTVPVVGSLAAGGVASGAVPAALAAGGTAAGVGGAVASGTAAGTAAGTGGSVANTAGVIGKLGGWGSLIGIGSQFAGQYLQNRSNNQALDRQIAASERAAEIEAQSQREALDFAKAAYGREQEQLAPYVGAGGAAVSKLSELMGLGTPPPYKPLPVQAPIPAAPGVMVGDPRLGALSGVSGPAPTPAVPPTAANGGGMVLMQAPDGSRRPVPEALVSQMQSKGAQIVNSGPKLAEVGYANAL